MTHSFERTHWVKEGGFALGGGFMYGLTSVAVGHPFDTIKTKMQAQPGYEKAGMLRTFGRTLKYQGIIGLYRGSIPPLWGSGIIRSSQFAVFEAMYTRLNNTGAVDQIPGTFGVQFRVIIAGLTAALVRSLIETPLEYAKVRRQTQQSWQLSKLYTGLGITLARSSVLLTSYFILIDSGRRHFPNQFNMAVVGPFLASGVSATLAWWIVWPLEYMKTQIQAEFGRKKSLAERLKKVVVSKGGFIGLYRGILPGSLRSFVANGCAMVVMSFAQRKVTDLGLRK